MTRPAIGGRLTAGIELGGTKAIALIARGRDVVAMEQMPTGFDPAQTLARLGDQLDLWAQAHGQFEALGIGSFGPVGIDRRRSDYGHITATPKPGWSHVDVVGTLAARFDVPVAFDTDVAAAGLAEYHWGAAKGCRTLVYITVGTGIGAGLVIDGKPVHGLVHPEFGHIRVRRPAEDRFAGICPFHGDCLEGIASGPAIEARVGAPGNMIADADPAIAASVDALAEAMAILILTASPERIVIGGGVLQNRPALFAPLRSRTADLLANYLPAVDRDMLYKILVGPALKELAGPLGAIALTM